MPLTMSDEHELLSKVDASLSEVATRKVQVSLLAAPQLLIEQVFEIPDS
jgi:hypothetical protein